MDDGLNVTYITLDGYVELNKYRYLYFVIMLTAYILIICSNSIIVYLIWRHQNLHEPMYIFIAALSVNSVLFSTAIYPKLLIDSLSEKQIISHGACFFQWFVFYSSGGSDFLVLAAMAYDRYVSICKPLQYATIMRTTTVNICLGLAWLLPACQVAGGVAMIANRQICNFSLEGIICNSLVQKLICVSSRVIYVYGMIGMFTIGFFPVFFILFTYTKIFIVSSRSCREVRRKAAQTCLPHLIVLINFSCLFAFDMIIARLEYNFPKVVRLIVTLQMILFSPLFNPIIYGMKMKEISKHLKRLFCSVKQT
ncbi:olfactory receptor 11A1-like [Sparus aurata]|uniref:olfactory receptor 11A1-like n=1 Tax=Sparus aurata TaxID=8175 RepID=UPI0011C0D080|nr:olfactory receptor 11A1-like [Sparus aurata]